MFKKFEVGTLFNEGKKRYKEGIKFDVDDSGCNITICYNSPTAKERREIKQESFRIGFHMEDNVIIMLFKFGNLNWMDSPYSVHLSKNLTTFQELTENKGLALKVHFIEANTGILKVIRLIGLESNFSKELISKIRLQKQMPFEGYDYNLNKIYSKYSTDQLVDIVNNIVS